MAWTMDYCDYVILRKRSLCLWMVQIMGFLFIAPGGAVSQFPPPEALCTSPLMRGGRIFINGVREDVPVGSTVGNLQLVGLPGQISLKYAEPKNRNLNFNPASQNLTVRMPLDKEQYDYIDISVICEMLDGGFRIPIQIKISIADVNDNPPQFLADSYAANVSELMPVGVTILSGIEAFDADGDNWKVTFEVLQNTPFSDHFTFPTETSGNLVLIKPLDYEQTHTIELHIVARDHHPSTGGRLAPQLNSTVTATIELYDGDDQNPAFTTPSYLAYVTENAPIGTAMDVIPPLHATDLDVGINATITYTFESDVIHVPPQSDYFNMDNTTGAITLKNDVLRRGEQFALLVKAAQVDNSNRYTTTILFIQVQAANENQPRFIQKQYAVSLVENVPPESYVTTVSALDNDVEPPTQGSRYSYSVFEEGTVLTYGFSKPDRVNDFTIDPRTGVIRTTKALSYERQARYNISLNVTDGQWFDYASLVLDLVNVNNNNPVFGRDTYHFQGHKEPNFFVGAINAVDLDVGSSLTYSLVQNSSLFSITPNGEIYLVGDPNDVPDDDVISLFVSAEDETTPPRKDAAVVMITFGVGSAVAMAAQTDLVVIIILGVLSGCLLLIIAVLSVYIYRKAKSFDQDSRGMSAMFNEVHKSLDPVTLIGYYLSNQNEAGHASTQRAPPRSATQPYNPEVDHIDAYFETSKSFERGINDLPSDYQNTYVGGHEGVYKPTSRERHLALYHDVATDKDNTTVQENPFQFQREGTPTSRSSNQPRTKGTPRGSTETGTSFTGYSAQSLGHSDPYSHPESRSNRSDPHSSHGDNRQRSPRHPSRGMHAVNEIDYDSAMAPMDDDVRDYSSPSVSDPSFRGSGGSLSTFKVGNSTQALVPPHSPAGSSVFRGKGSSVSFIDDHQVNVYHPDNAINPNAREKPEITVYY